ncbi:MAG: FAD/NAD(P)-binding protein [Nitrosospira sp.]|nr:FAD/NAD(P)-binding protein [Nitrosospira sp.]
MSSASSLPVKVITIIGAGYSGTITAVNILRQNLGVQVRVILVDRNTRPGRGLAYRTWDDNFWLCCKK